MSELIVEQIFATIPKDGDNVHMMVQQENVYMMSHQHDVWFNINISQNDILQYVKETCEKYQFLPGKELTIEATLVDQHNIHLRKINRSPSSFAAQSIEELEFTFVQGVPTEAIMLEINHFVHSFSSKK